MKRTFDSFYSNDERHLDAIADESREVVFLSTGFDPAGKSAPHPPRQLQLTAASARLIATCLRVLRPGGWMFLYGPPVELPFWALQLSVDNASSSTSSRIVFKYWIALDIEDAPANKTLKPSHLGVLMFLKESGDHNSHPQPHLNIDAARSPHLYCAACGKTVKDWGGKKHLMNPHGAALSDVWRDLPRRVIRDNLIPEDVIQRLALLTDATRENCLHIIQSGRGLEVMSASNPTILNHSTPTVASSTDASFPATLELDHIHDGDCVSFLNRVKELHPRGAFDLAFADPPYNLEKKYSAHDDAMADAHYIEWCDSWLAAMADNLKPGGSLLVLNLPKWCLHHVAFLSKRLEFRHWIVWDALSDPRGKIMPAHYGLLWFTKPGAKPVCNYSPTGNRAHRDFVQPPDAPKYCLRASCIKNRKLLGDDEKVELTDVWWDVHRIKHKRDRDAHPCQLPEKLMARIIRLTTRPGDVVFDPFGGAGTTAIAAAKLGRKFVVTEIDSRYAKITREKLEAMKAHADMFGEFVVPRKSIERKCRDVTKRQIESYLQGLAVKLRRVPTEDDVTSERPEMLREIDLLYPNRGAAFKRAKIGLAN